MIEIFDCEQGSEQWFACRMGIPTSSMFSTLIGVNKDPKDKKTRTTYMMKLAGEILTGEPMENYTNQHMDRGREQEGEARDLYAMLTNADIQRVGFIKSVDKGASPDSLIGKDGGLEIKTALAHIQIDRLLKKELPSEHRGQVQGNLWVAEREWWDFCSYCPKLPPFILRVYRDEGYIATLAGAVTAFNTELAEMVERVRNYGPEALAA